MTTVHGISHRLEVEILRTRSKVYSCSVMVTKDELRAMTSTGPLLREECERVCFVVKPRDDGLEGRK